mgnify:CR=1 FL=1
MPDEINTNPASAESEETQEDINALRQIRMDKLVQNNNRGSVRPRTGNSRQFRRYGGQGGLYMRTNDVKARYGQGEFHRYP